MMFVILNEELKHVARPFWTGWMQSYERSELQLLVGCFFLVVG